MAIIAMYTSSIAKARRKRVTMPNSTTWVVYMKLFHSKPSGLNAICNQGEWEDMERTRPGQQNLVKAGIATEPEAERYARNGPGLGIASELPEGIEHDHGARRLALSGRRAGAYSK
jgi:hypothetical protein